jgi:protein-tyrosine-phosphatase
MAEALLRAYLPETSWRILSAGTHAIGGDPPTRGAHDAIYRWCRLDMSNQRSAPLTVDLLRRSDHVFTMSRNQAMEAAALFPPAASRIRLLGAFAAADDEATGPADPYGGRADPMEIADPMGGDSEAYEACCSRLDASVRALVEWLNAGASPAAATTPAAVSDWPERP